MREFIGGVASLLRGFAYWRRRPGLMALGLIPAAIVALVLVAGLVAWGFALPGVTEAITPFANGWPGLWRDVIRSAIGTAMFGAALVMVAVTFTALTLIVGEPFYERIWRHVEQREGDAPADVDEGFWRGVLRSVGDSLRLLLATAAVGVCLFVGGFVPVVGQTLVPVLGALTGGWFLAVELTGFLGAIVASVAGLVVRPWRLRFTSLVFHMQEAGLNAVPIVALMSFLIGVVLAFQGATQLRQFGAEVFVVDLIAISVLRELGILLTAIIVAGRSASAFTASIGSMKMREEIDAMRTLGLDPIEVLVVPRVLALILTFPVAGFAYLVVGLVADGGRSSHRFDERAHAPRLTERSVEETRAGMRDLDARMQAIETYTASSNVTLAKEIDELR